MTRRSLIDSAAQAFRLVGYSMLLVWLCLSSPSSAQTQISCGQVVTSSIAVLGEEDRYTFSASNGDVVTLRQVPTTNNFTPQMTLFDPNNHQIATDARLIIQPLTLTGTYTIKVTDSGFSSGHTGGYQLLWQRTKNPCNPSPIAPCQTVKGNVRTPVSLNAYQFNGTIGQRVDFQLRALTSLYDHASRVELFDPDGLLVTDGGALGIISQILGKTGVYTVTVGTNLVSGMAGNYTLTMGNIEALLTTPNGGEVLLAGSTISIQWLSFANSPPLTSHDILLSTDGGATFPTLIVGGLTQQSYNWNIPPTLATNNARIRIIARDNAGTACQDDSDASFTVIGAASATSVAYRYDELNRLIQAIYEDGNAITYTYDAAGNRLTEVVAPIPYYRVACNPSSVSVNLGDSVTSTCTFTSLNGFNGAVNLACVAAPPGVSCSFSPSTVTPPANGAISSTLTVSVSLNTVPGVYSFQVKGTSGNFSRIFDMTLTVRDFRLACTPSSAVVNVGAGTTATCTLSSMNGFTSAVTLICSGAPSSITCGFNPTSVTPPANGSANSALTINVAADASPGIFTFQVSAASGSLARAVNITLTVLAPGDQLLLNEDFSGGIPSTWTVIDGGTDGGIATTWTTANPGGRSFGAPFAAPFAIVDSANAGGFATQDEQLITPTINTSGCRQVLLEFSNQFRWWMFGLNEFADVDITTDGGSVWTNVLRIQGADDGPNTKSIDITSAIAANPSNVKIRFHYYNGNDEWWWAIDNVKVRCVHCVASLAPGSSQSFAANGGTASVSVAIDTGCPWTASTTATFIHITSGGSGTGNGTVQYTVDANAGSTIRNDTITIAGHTYTVYQGIDFADVPPSDQFYTEIGKLSARGVTLGCNPNGPLYCPNAPVLREQMSAFIMRAKGEFNPPMPASQRFGDVPPSNQFYNFIDRLAVLGITLGCQPGNPPLYCPSDPVKREQMSAFILRGLGEFNPPTPGSQRFGDVPPSNQFYNFIDRLAVLQITLGCQPGNPPLFCPNDPVTRGQMAAFLVRAFGL